MEVAIHLLRPVYSHGEYCVKSIAHSGFQCGLLYVCRYVCAKLNTCVVCMCVCVGVEEVGHCHVTY